MEWFVASGVVAGLLAALITGGIIWLYQAPVRWLMRAWDIPTEYHLPKHVKRLIATVVIFFGGVLALAYCIDFGRVHVRELDEWMIVRMWAWVGLVQQVSYFIWKGVRR